MRRCGIFIEFPPGPSSRGKRLEPEAGREGGEPVDLLVPGKLIDPLHRHRACAADLFLSSMRTEPLTATFCFFPLPPEGRLLVGFSVRFVFLFCFVFVSQSMLQFEL